MDSAHGDLEVGGFGGVWGFVGGRGLVRSERVGFGSWFGFVGGLEDWFGV